MVDVVIKQHYEEALSSYKKLQPPLKEGGFWKIDGAIDVVDDTGYIWDSYDIRIVFQRDYPMTLPSIFETSGKIPKEADWHNSLGCCLGTEAKLHRELSDGVTLIRWLDRHVQPYLANHIHKKETGNYANGEFSHYEKGIFEYYARLFNLGTVEEVVNRIRLVIGIDKLGRNSLCFCGSSKIYKRCYMINSSDHFLNIPKSVFKKDLSLLLNWLAKKVVDS